MFAGLYCLESKFSFAPLRFAHDWQLEVFKFVCSIVSAVVLWRARHSLAQQLRAWDPCLARQLGLLPLVPAENTGSPADRA